MTDYIGHVFGKWTVVKIDHHSFWLCKCECGFENSIRIDTLIFGRSTKCKFCRNKKHGHSLHNESKSGRTKIYNVWLGMLSRCNNKNNLGYHDYGGRGIRVCDAWQKFEDFYADVGDRPSGMSLDRINNELGYFKENCRWSTRSEQARNTRSNSFHTVNGKTATIAEWAEIKGMPPRQLRLRMVTKNLTMEEALKLPYNPRK